MRKISNLILLLFVTGAMMCVNSVYSGCNSANGVLVEEFGARTTYIDLGHRWSNALVRTKDSVYGAVITPKDKLPKEKNDISPFGYNRKRVGKGLQVAEGCHKNKIKWRIEETYFYYRYEVRYRSVLETTIREDEYKKLPVDCQTNCWVFDKEKLWYNYDASGKPYKGEDGKYVKVKN